MPMPQNFPNPNRALKKKFLLNLNLRFNFFSVNLVFLDKLLNFTKYFVNLNDKKNFTREAIPF